MIKSYFVVVRGETQTWTSYGDSSKIIALHNFEMFASDVKLVFGSKTKELLNPGDFPFLADAVLLGEVGVTPILGIPRVID